MHTCKKVDSVVSQSWSKVKTDTNKFFTLIVKEDEITTMTMILPNHYIYIGNYLYVTNIHIENEVYVIQSCAQVDESWYEHVETVLEELRKCLYIKLYSKYFGLLIMSNEDTEGIR